MQLLWMMDKKQKSMETNWSWRMVQGLPTMTVRGHGSKYQPHQNLKCVQ
jgi:hypothetical protein